MSVIPYVALSLMAGVGSLDVTVARRLALSGGAWLLVLLSTALGAVALFPIAFPDYETASFFSSAMITEPAEVDLLDLYIPANPIYSMVHNLMPAIVLFSLVLGVALLTLPGRSKLVDVLSVAADGLMRDGMKIYQSIDAGFEPRWFPVFMFLDIKGPTSITGLAR